MEMEHTTAVTTDDSSPSQSQSPSRQQRQRPKQPQKPSSRPSCRLGEELFELPWHEIGNCSRPADVDTIVDQLASILEVRLMVLVVHRRRRRSRRREGGDDGGGGGGGGDVANGDDEEFLRRDDPDGEMTLCPALVDQLREYVSLVARRYNDVRFHRLEHAAHVTVSANKLLSMMIEGEEPTASCREGEQIENGGGGGVNGDDAAGGAGAVRTRRRVSSSRRTTLQHVEMVRGIRPEAAVTGGDACTCAAEKDDDDLDVDGCFDPTFGIGSDPLARFALVFAALIHDVDHRGVSNAQLVGEGDDIAIVHNDISLLEQNSLQVAFTLLARPRLGLLARCIMPTGADRAAFRKLVIGIVLATDISSPDRMQVTQSKWTEAFNGGSSSVSSSAMAATTSAERQQPAVSSADGDAGDESNATPASGGANGDREAAEALARRRHSMYHASSNDMSRRRMLRIRLGIRRSLHLDGKLIDIYAHTRDGDVELRASAVLELVMHASDVAHTMQGFAVFCAWNRRLYGELLEAYRGGRNPYGHPGANWYKNQINFLDAYVIPLAEKLEVCGAFGSRGSILLYFAMENKRRWIKEGYEISREMIEEMEADCAEQEALKLCVAKCA